MYATSFQLQIIINTTKPTITTITNAKSHYIMSYENLFQCYECDSNKHENCTENKSGEAVFCGPEQIGCLIARGQTCFFNSASFSEDRCQAMIYDLLKGKEDRAGNIDPVFRIRASRRSLLSWLLNDGGGGTLCG